MLYSIVRALLVVPFFKAYFRMEVKGTENIPKRGGFILACNHTSYLDPLALGAASRRPLNFMARDSLFRIPLFGSLIAAVDAFPVKRDSADKSALKEAMRRVRRGGALALFPEGTRQDSKAEPDKPQAGIGFLAAKLAVPVIPAFISGTEKALPKHAKVIRRERISVSFGKQISIEGRMPYEDIAMRIMDDIRHLAC
ncbi:MAG: 1-acyl-sn-glycerol-3-phosphate acyltransferase [Candidatus Omnitrophica bacterium]|nr:1-acyl-sn-glycerol-3-phosphate acyltransferase [Candidatus Omnitrophota bacterium]